MRILLISTIFFLFSCAAIDEAFLLESTLMKEGNAQEILNELHNPELRKGKIFVLSNLQYRMIHSIRVNKKVVEMWDKEIQVFDLMEGDNSIYTFLPGLFGTEVSNCNDKPYIFNADGINTQYFIVTKPTGREFVGGRVNCYKDVQVSEDVFFYFIDNPRSRWRAEWILNQ